MDFIFKSRNTNSSGKSLEEVIEELIELYSHALDRANTIRHYHKQSRGSIELSDEKIQALALPYKLESELNRVLEIYFWLNGKEYPLPEFDN
ncbi:MAG TPA: hypothetical protein DCQ93_07680 [Bacteroidetes bacterium]|nr:hypothetical protein [Bacteroidota bacterium]